MACSVLASVRLLTTALMLGFAPSAALVSAGQADCSPKAADVPSTAEPNIRSLEEHLKTGPFYKELVLEFGKPLTCNLTFDDGAIGLTYTFSGRVHLIARIDPMIETSEQTIETVHLKMRTALALLKAAERDAYGPRGCGIRWEHPTEESAGGPKGFREAIYRGATCNCQARVSSRDNYAVSLALKSAC